MFNSKQLAKLIIILFFAQISFEQLGFSYEIVIITVPIAFKSDYGLRNKCW